VFKELKLIEQWGSGIKRIKLTCKEYGLKEPLIQEKNDFVDVELYRPIIIGTDEKTLETVGKLAEAVGKPAEVTIVVFDQEQQVLDYLKEHKTIVSKMTEQLLGIKESRARELLKKMVEKNLIAKSGSGKNTYYNLQIIK
jgi:ATP-dependent DNA helicase RecG